MIRLLDWFIGSCLGKLVFLRARIGGIMYLIELVKMSCCGIFTLITDHHLLHNRPDLMLVLKHQKKVFLIDVAIPGDSRISQKINVDLKMELSQLWHSTVHIVPIIVGALGSIPKNLESMLEKLDISPSVIPSFQRSVLYSTAAILRRHMNI